MKDQSSEKVLSLETLRLLASVFLARAEFSRRGSFAVISAWCHFRRRLVPRKSQFGVGKVRTPV